MSSHDDNQHDDLSSRNPRHPHNNATRKRRSRAKRRSEWEEVQFRTNAPYARYIGEISARYPTLTPQEVRVCACVKLMMTSWQIGQRLHVTEKSVDELRRRARRKMNLSNKVRLLPHLLRI